MADLGTLEDIAVTGLKAVGYSIGFVVVVKVIEFAANMVISFL